MSIFKHMIGAANNMRANTIEVTQTDERLKEYQRQQDRLKSMTSNSEKMKSVSADIMIKNLLKQNFLKPNDTATGNTSLDNKVNLGMDLPNWLECDSYAVPAVYKHLWSLVKTANNFADTHRVSQLLLTSGLQTEVLGFIWNLSNKQVPGQLTKQEFYIVLTLVGLAQTGHTFTNLSILNSVTTAPIPVLQTKVLEKCLIVPCATNDVYSSDFNQVKVSNEEILKLTNLGTGISKCNDFPIVTNTPLINTTNSYENTSLKDSVEIKAQKKLTKLSHSKGLFDLNNSNTDCSKVSNFPLIGSSPTAELEDDEFSEFHSVFMNESAMDIKSYKDDPMISGHSDEFTDFQCADISVDPLQTMIIGQRKEIPKIPLPKNLNGKLSNFKTNIMKISPESEKKLKVLSQSGTLSTLPESRISANNKVSKMPNIPVVGGSKDIGMRLANHSLGSNSESVKNQKYPKHKQPYSAVEIPFPHKYGSIDELFPKCFQKSASSKTFVLKETKIRTVENVETDFSSKFDTELNLNVLPSVKNTRKIEIPILGTFNETTLPTQCEESAAKEQTVELFSAEEDKYSALREIELEVKQVQSAATMPNSDGNDEFGEFFSADFSFETPAGDDDLWGEWNILVETKVDDKKHLENISGIKVDISKPFEKITLNQSSFSFDLLSLNERNDKKEDEMSNIQLEISNDDKPEENGISLMSVNESNPKENKLPFENDKNYQNFITLDDMESSKSSYFTETSLDKNVCESNFDATEQDFGEFLARSLNSSDSGVLQKCDSLPNLDLKMTLVEKNDQELIQKKCLLTCLNLMQQALEIFSRVSSMAVLAEVFSTQEVVNYLNCLNVVYHISRRVCVNCSEISSVQEEIEKIWQKLITYCYEFDISLKEDVENCMQIGIQCNLCLGFVGNDVIDQGLTSYHPSCANLWVNCIDSTLPCPV